mmetsp:Transcript_34725/g.63877  ORF Transcript_34725/g.63877 Transcript_34725/m.63877 type:complete len:83 (-) Transcript_34725:478-726(-)
MYPNPINLFIGSSDDGPPDDLLRKIHPEQFHLRHLTNLCPPKNVPPAPLTVIVMDLGDEGGKVSVYINPPPLVIACVKALSG